MEEMNNSFVFMAFATGKESTEGSSIKRYIGVGSSFVLGVNPNKVELEKMYDTTLDKDPEYLSKTTEGIDTARIDFIVKTDPSKNTDWKSGEPIEFITKYSLFLRNEYRYNRDKTKVQVIDKYGRTCWVTVEQAKAHEIPMYKNGPANIDSAYRPCYVGEEDLVKFLIAYLNIPSPMKYIDNKWVMVDNPEECEAGLEKISNYFKGDFSELKSILALQPKNKLKLAYGIRTTDEGRQYQAFFTDMPMKNGVSDYSRLKKAIEERKANGGYSTTEFSTEDLHEYVVEATKFEQPTTANTDPFGEASTDSNLPF